MCGRFTLKTNASEWVQQLFAGIQLLDVPENPPRYNIAPTQPILCVVQSNPGSAWRVASMRWGLVPAWSADLSIGSRMLNARCESLSEKPSFRNPFRERRCLVIADGYYEWQATGNKKEKKPFWIHPRQGGVFAMAGLWEMNLKINPSQPILTTTIITTHSNETTKPVHDRMPVILHPDDFASWLNPSNHSIDQLQALLQPAAEDFFALQPANPYVNNARNEGEQCLVES